ncbi:MAG: DUF4145 domain-containing protein [Bacilli bacterium]
MIYKKFRAIKMQALFSYIKAFSDTTPVPFGCPSCKKHTLILDKDKFYKHDNAEKLYSEEWFEPDDHCEIIYTSIYECFNPECKCQVSSSGTGKVIRDYSFDEYGQTCKGYYEVYKPKQFSPTLSFFEIPESVPTEVIEVVFSAFELVLISPSAAVNRIRTAIEVILDEKNVDAGRNLFERITVKAKSIPAFDKIRNHMNALRILGNAGSHEDSLIKISDAEDTFEIMQTILNELYPTQSKVRLAAKIEKIIKVKGPLTGKERRHL